MTTQPEVWIFDNGKGDDVDVYASRESAVDALCEWNDVADEEQLRALPYFYENQWGIAIEEHGTVIRTALLP